MTTTVAPDLKPDHTESEEWPTLGRDPTHATREDFDAHSRDPTQASPSAHRRSRGEART
jgi:hypothetical protein